MEPNYAIAWFHFSAREYAEPSPLSAAGWRFHSSHILMIHSELALIWA